MSVQVAQSAPVDFTLASEKEPQIEIELIPGTPPREGRYLVQSPYEEFEHLLDLDTLDNENALLARALAKLRNVREDYATAPYVESFNWPEVIEELRALAKESGSEFKKASFYVVAFRSRIKPDTHYGDLGALDKAAHAEAVASGGFLKYWFGSPDSQLANLATCLWRSREDAIAGGRGPAHRKAAMSTRSLYAYWKIDQHRLTISDNVDEWEITEWE
ncbi:unnamed protein product [Clonostachys rosea]|uniref:Uncharacterized protein n=1 Tax=Bionectria ochroleuca TaxID=29856 RepID=A0ABY6UU11_BIOOC|nr:unnamed protein product [Clonostachys rosea]